MERHRHSRGIHVQTSLCWLPPKRGHPEHGLPQKGNTATDVCSFYPRELTKDSASKAFITDRLCRHPPLSMYQNSRPPERKQDNSLTTLCCSLGTVNHLINLGMVGKLLKFKWSDINQRPTLQVGLCKDRSLRSATLILFFTKGHLQLFWLTKKKTKRKLLFKFGE